MAVQKSKKSRSMRGMRRKPCRCQLTAALSVDATSGETHHSFHKRDCGRFLPRQKGYQQVRLTLQNLTVALDAMGGDFGLVGNKKRLAAAIAVFPRAKSHSHRWSKRDHISIILH